MVPFIQKDICQFEGLFATPVCTMAIMSAYFFGELFVLILVSIEYKMFRIFLIVSSGSDAILRAVILGRFCKDTGHPFHRDCTDYIDSC